MEEHRDPVALSREASAALLKTGSDPAIVAIAQKLIDGAHPYIMYKELVEPLTLLCDRLVTDPAHISTAIKGYEEACTAAIYHEKWSKEDAHNNLKIPQCPFGYNYGLSIRIVNSIARHAEELPTAEKIVNAHEFVANNTQNTQQKRQAWAGMLAHVEELSDPEKIGSHDHIKIVYCSRRIIEKSDGPQQREQALEIMLKHMENFSTAHYIIENAQFVVEHTKDVERKERALAAILRHAEDEDSVEKIVPNAQYVLKETHDRKKQKQSLMLILKHANSFSDTSVAVQGFTDVIKHPASDAEMRGQAAEGILNRVKGLLKFSEVDAGYKAIIKFAPSGHPLVAHAKKELLAFSELMPVPPPEDKPAPFSIRGLLRKHI